MDALLILGGTLLFICALVWLIMRAFDVGLLWGWGSLVPPVTLLFALLHWRKARTPVVLAGLAAGTIVVGLAQMAASDPERVADIFSLRWMHPAKPAGDLVIELDGELNGQRFNPQQAELINGGLSLREGQDFYARRELLIRLPEQPQGGIQLDVLPQDRQAVPVIEMNWLLPEQDLPEARLIQRGYSLHLDLQPVAPNKLAGEFHLGLPARFKTSLSGKLEVYTDRLRYRDGKLDARHDSRETLVKVIEDYLQRRFITTEVELAALPLLNFADKELQLDVTAQISGSSMQLPIELVKDAERGWMVTPDRYPPLKTAQPKPVEMAKPSTPELADEPGPARSALDRRLRFSLQRLLRNPSQYENLLMRVQSERGSTAQGRFVGISKTGELIIRSQVEGAGEASFNLQPDEIIQIELLEP